MIYAVGWDLTGEQHWLDMYRRYAWPAARESVLVPLQIRNPYAFLQEQASLEVLHAIENRDMDLKQAWLEAMRFVADRVEGCSWRCLDYKPVDVSALDMDWRHWPPREWYKTKYNYDLPTPPQEFRTEKPGLRDPGESMLTQLMCPEGAFHRDQIGLLKLALTQVRYDMCITYGFFYLLAAYWRAVKRGFISLP
jgi:hypothetical protein